MRIPKQGEFYRHFKNNLYQIVAVAEHSENGEKFVIYQALYGDFKIYARPLEMFVSEVDHEKYPDVTQKYRFEQVEFAEQEANTQSGEDVQEVREIQSCECRQEERELRSGEAAQKTGAIKSEEVQHENISDGAVTSTSEGPEPGLLEFLDTDNWDEKYNILVSLRDKMTDKLVDSLAVSMDVVIPEGPLDHRYEELKICLRTRQKYENQRLR